MNNHIDSSTLDSESITQHLKDIGTPATLDTSIKGGIVSVTLDSQIMDALQTYDTAIDAFKMADKGSASYVYEAFKIIPWTPPTQASFDVLVLNHNITTQQERDILISTM